MARTGRPPTPIEVKRKRGTDRPDRTAKLSETVALRPADGVPPVPISLGVDGRAYWAEVWVAAGQWLSPQLDRVAVEAACSLVDQIAEMRRMVATDGIALGEPIVTPAGMVVGEKKVAHPLIKELRAAEKQLQGWLSVLGFDPTARARLGLAEVKKQSKLEELMERRDQRSR